MDQNALRGAKSIADKIDMGSLILPVTPDDTAQLETIISQTGWEMPNLKISVYKNRRGRYKSVLLWCKANLGCCRIQPVFMTDFQYQLQNVDNLVINVEKPSAW